MSHVFRDVMERVEKIGVWAIASVYIQLWLFVNTTIPLHCALEQACFIYCIFHGY